MKQLLVVLFSISLLTLQAQNITQVQDINTAGNSYPWQLTVSNNKLFFIATDAAGITQLYLTEGTPATTQALGPLGGINNSFSEVTAYNNNIYFSYSDGVNGQELWVSDGTSAGTKMLADLYPGATGSFPTALTVANGKLFFLGTNADGERRLFVSDGTPAGTNVLRNAFNNYFNGLQKFVVFNNNILFISDNGTGSGYGFWKSDGTPGGTSMVKPDIIPSLPGGTTAIVNGMLFLNIDDGVHGSELWVTDATTAGTTLVKNMVADGGGVFGNGNPQSFIAYNNKAYFSASDGTHGQEPWVSDGTDAGTTMLKDLLPGTDGSLPYANTVFDGKLYFAAWQTGELWVSEGTEATTTKVIGLLSSTKFAATWNGKMYLIFGDNSQVYESDGSAAGTKLMQVDNAAGPVTRYFQFGSDQYFQEYQGDLYFQASCPGITNGFEPVRLSSGALPLQLLSFTGVMDKNIDKLQWVTNNESNTATFIIQKSADGLAFTNTGEVAALGNTTAVQHYYFTQNTAANPAGFYRLKMLDKDGRFSFSHVIRLQRNTTNTAIYSIDRKTLVIQNTAGKACYWQLVSPNGTILKKGTSTDAVINIPVTGAAGTYVLSYSLNNQKQYLRFLVL